ncbi:flagellar protein FlaG [Paenibacillus sp. 1-18]|uniref:flagellar protein FlaG n=1 Tax=Paenibacillus sp. 1-18 TaxID=1333846 RepID=UPI0004708217|nr:flagellar protein FlaG [Paenibacillus sp. 1-18]
MNLQFSVSTSTTVDGVKGGDLKSEYTGSHNTNSGTIIQTIKTDSELTKYEKQGLSVSLGDEQLIKAIDRAVKALQGPATTLEMSVHEKTHQILVKVLNKDTGELIREIPPEKTLDLVAKMMEIAGILVDQKA